LCTFSLRLFVKHYVTKFITYFIYVRLLRLVHNTYGSVFTTHLTFRDL